ncbi:MAG: ribosomal protein S18-alanine N-acetyltransferase [Eubacteriales bacterium]
MQNKSINKIIYRPMEDKDVDQVAEIEKHTFPTPWSRKSFYSEINENNIAHYIVAEKDNKIVGYGGLWHIITEMHITNIAVDKQYRGMGIGESILSRLIEMAEIDELTEAMSLEVRRSNFAAQNLYRKHGFKVIGIREKYYEDNREDAFIMQKDIEK